MMEVALGMRNGRLGIRGRRELPFDCLNFLYTMCMFYFLKIIKKKKLKEKRRCFIKVCTNSKSRFHGFFLGLLNQNLGR